MWYNAGTITATAGSQYVDGQGTSFVGPVQASYGLLAPDGRLYEILQVISATRLQLVRPYAGGTVANVPYDIVPMTIDLSDLIARAQALVDRYQSFLSGVGQGLFGGGSAAAPGMRFAGDQDTGLFSSSANVMGAAAGGMPIVLFRPSDIQVQGAVEITTMASSVGYALGDRSAVRGVSVANYGVTFGVNAGSLGIATVVAGFGSVIFSAGGAERMAIDPSGNLLVGVATGSRHEIAKNIASNAGNVILAVSSNGEPVAVFRSVGSGTLGSSANTALSLNRDNGTGRSINAAGTLNASGADYAEYMLKAAGCGIIAKGDVCGVDREGKLTKTWADAISFVVKSTDPSLVGGDTWSAHLPARPEQDDDEAADAFASRLTEWEALLEQARLCVDRIAFCGQVPCNVSGDFAVGDYIVAVQDGDGIKAVAVKADAVTLAQYMTRIGKVWAARDGRAWIDVQHG